MKLTAPKQRQGDHFENLAKVYLEANGLIFFAKNWHHKNIGELDLVMIDKKQQIPCLVIVEVRQRKTSYFGTSLDSITITKQRKIIKSTEAFLQIHPQFESFDIRFDLVTFDKVTFDSFIVDLNQLPKPTWISNAFNVES